MIKQTKPIDSFLYQLFQHMSASCSLHFYEQLVDEFDARPLLEENNIMNGEDLHKILTVEYKKDPLSKMNYASDIKYDVPYRTDKEYIDYIGRK